MKVRRVSTGQTTDGTSVVVQDLEIEGVTTDLVPGLEFHRLWGQDEAPTLPTDGAEPSYHSYFPAEGGFRFTLFTLPSASEIVLEGEARQRALAKFEADLPGMLGHMEPQNPGMHRTDTVDFEYVISGEVWLELDGGREVHLKAGDTVVQNGTRHAWRNRSTQPCQMVVCLIGAKRE